MIHPYEIYGSPIQPLKRICFALAAVAQWIEHLAYKLKGRWFDSQSGTGLGCGMGSRLGVCERQPTDISLPLFLPPFPSLRK